MADTREVLKYLKLSVEIEQNPGEEIREHLRKTLQGTPGKLRYRHTSLDSKLPFLGRIYFLILRKSGKLIGSIAFSLRENKLPEKDRDVWYVRYFSVQAPLRDQVYKQEKLTRSEKKKQIERQKKKNSHGDSLLKNFVQPYFDNPVEYFLGDKTGSAPSIVYATVEKGNLRSWKFTEQVGFETVSRIRTTIFSRYNPRKHPNVDPIPAAEKEDQLERLRDFYRGHSFYTEQNLFYDDNYLVWQKNGEILAGCQANPELWEIVDYPGGISTFLIKNGVHLPFFRRYIEPGYQKFVAVEGIWFKEGQETCLHDLFETALAIHGYNSLLIWLDERCPLQKTIDSLGKMGIIGKFFKPALVDIRVKFNQCSDEDKEIYSRRPAYISCFDLT